MQALFDGANQNVNTAAQDICSDLGRGSLSLDQAILACVFHHVESFCPSGEDDEGIVTFLKELEWELPKVVWDWTASPPPPPPVVHGPFEDLLREDPAGMELAREKILELWPKISAVAQQSSGSNVGREHSADGLGYGPVYYISKYSMSTAFLSTAHFKDQDSLSARIVQARFTGMFRFACKAFVEFMSDVNVAGAGSNGGESAFGNPGDFSSPHDRNFLVMASALFAESYHSQTGHLHPTSVYDFWHDNCEAPAVKRSAMPTSLWRLDPMVYGEEDLFSHLVGVESFAPLRTFGSLAQIRDLSSGGLGGDFLEDYTNVATSSDFEPDRRFRTRYSLQSLYRDRICNPTYKYSIRDAVGNPPEGGNSRNPEEFIRDASTAKLPKWDMQVPNGMLGDSGIRRPHITGCGMGIESGGCDTELAPNYYDSSLWSWAYVTSSQCESAF